MLHSKKLAKIDGIIHGFGFRGVSVGEYLDELGIRDRFVFETFQEHGNRVHYLMWPARYASFVSRSEAGGPKKDIGLNGDAFISDRPGLVCFVRSADCVPILIADARQSAVAAVHAGWRGTAVNVVGETLRAMNEVFGSKPQDCVAAIGPRICRKCYEVGEEVIEAIEKLRIDRNKWCDGRYIDLGILNLELLQRAGIRSENIDLFPHCTYCDDRFASWRRDGREDERQINFVVVASDTR